ncbi:hypothetical protein HID58_079411, partial [Brassica napus]
MGTVDPPDLPLSPTKVGSSLGEAQGSDRLMKNDGEFTEVLDVTKSLGIKDSEMVGSSDLSLKALNQKVMMEEQAQVLIKSKGSYAGVVQEIRDDSLEKGKESSKEKEKDQEEPNTENQKERGSIRIQTMEVHENGIATGEKIPEAVTKGNNEEWEDVSLGKASCSPRELEFGQVSILTKSRFSVLAPVEEGDPPENEDKQSQSGEDGSSSEEKEEEMIHRKYLPRDSKINH